MANNDQCPTILAVDHNRRNLQLLSQFLEREGYEPVTAATLDELDEQLALSNSFALVLVDLSGFDRRIWERCERLRTNGVPFLVISPRQSNAIQQESLAHGARGVLVKPLASRQLLNLIQNLLHQ